MVPLDSYFLIELLRLVVVLLVFGLLFLSQRFWFTRAWRLTARVGRPALRVSLRTVCVLLIAAIVIPVGGWLLGLMPRHNAWFATVGLWLSSSFFAYLAIKSVRGLDWLWQRAKRLTVRASRPVTPDTLPDPSRRYFFQTATYFAGAVPFVGALYGFAAERLHYIVERVEVPVAGLPPALDGLRIAQLSDIHIGPYLPRGQVRRAVELANEQGAHLTVVTGDFITGTRDPLETCIEELARLRAPLGVWGCNGNHEIYADCEDRAQQLFRQAGARLLRHENVELVWNEQPFNLIGVDYQRTRTLSGRRAIMLENVEPLVRRDVPNILLSHNPNAFPRAAELGIELTLAGHTHGGQVQVEILESRFSAAQFITEFIAGLYHRPLRWLSDRPTSDFSARIMNSNNQSILYVNRGLGTVGAPVRIGVPPEITLLTLRRA